MTWEEKDECDRRGHLDCWKYGWSRVERTWWLFKSQGNTNEDRCCVPKRKKLYQSCHILHKQGKYYIVHFKELFALDGKPANITKNDVERRNRIAKLLFDWGLVDFQAEDLTEVAPLNQIKVLSYKDKADWILESKYNIGKKKVVAETWKHLQQNKLNGSLKQETGH